MGEGDPFRAWLDDFERQVDAAVGRAGAPASPAAKAAQSAFNRWWLSEQEPVLAERAGLSPDLSLDAEARLTELTREKAALEGRCAGLEKDLARLREALAAGERRCGELQARGEQAAKEAAAAAERLEAERALHERSATALGESRVFLQRALSQAQQDEKAAREKLSAEEERARAAETAAAVAQARAKELESALATAREQLAAQGAALEELRRQSSIYSQRLIDAKERTDADVALLRQELKMSLEEFRILINTVKKAEPK